MELEIVDNVDTDLAPEISCWLRLGEGAGIYSITLEAVIEHHKDDPIKYQQRCRAAGRTQPSYRVHRGVDTRARNEGPSEGS